MILLFISVSGNNLKNPDEVAKCKLDLKTLRKIRSKKWNVIYTGLKHKREKEKKYFFQNSGIR
ncbi:hypothetical protein BGV40_00065 [Methanosarcina sp. Ant1]|nr:hypothetical protein BGV40_00065 [Methanosarcina sp. Ant1]